MVSELKRMRTIEKRLSCVLILVLVGYGLWVEEQIRKEEEEEDVLILVLVGYGLWGNAANHCRTKESRVLILVLVGYGLWAKDCGKMRPGQKSLNPCFGGIWSLRKNQHGDGEQICLNPCFGGIWSLRATFEILELEEKDVLILVLVGYGLWVNTVVEIMHSLCVLILVLVGYGLWDRHKNYGYHNQRHRLNPCFGGIWSLRRK